jgi:hypothetical protein
MKKHILNYDEYLTEGFSNPIASLFNTGGMGNVSSTTTTDTVGSHHIESGDQDKEAKHLKMHERGHHDDSWMRPSGNYKHRNWLVPNYEIFQNERQSMARFQIGQTIRCINPMEKTFGMMGKIVAFEDNTVRWEVLGSETGIGQTAKQYRCHAASLQDVSEEMTVIKINKRK